MAIDKFIDYKSGLQVTKISEQLAPTEAAYLDDNGKLKVKGKSYYFDGTKRMQFSSNTVLSGEFTFGIAFAPSTNFSLGKFVLNESTDGYLGFGKTQAADGIIQIKLDGKTAKNATLTTGAEAGTTKYQSLKFYENRLNIIFIQRNISNQITVRGMSGERLLLINADANTSGNITLNRLGGNSVEGFEGYIAEIFIEKRVLTQVEVRAIGKFWFEKHM